MSIHTGALLNRFRIAAFAMALATLAIPGSALAQQGGDRAASRATHAHGRPVADLGSAAGGWKAGVVSALDAGRDSSSTTAPTTTPTITSPSAGATVSGVVTFAATSSAAVVRFGITGSTWTADVPVQSGSASVQLDTYGVHGARQLTATDCDGTDCATSFATVDVTVSNAAITLTAPAKGTVVGSSVVAAVDAQGGGVRFELDGSPVADVGAAPYRATIDTSHVAAGSHTLSAVQCDSGFVDCDGRTAPPVSIVVQHRLRPVIKRVAPTPFSPNGDGRKDKAVVDYRLDVPHKVRWEVLNAGGKIVAGPRALGTQSAGSHTLTFDGTGKHGATLRSGSYVIRLLTSRVVSGGTITGAAEGGVRIDLAKPRATSPTARPHTFYPVRDHYLDHARISSRLSEPLDSLRWQILNGSGHTVRTLSQGRDLKGRVHVTWNGRDAGHRVVASGSYRIRLVMRDVAGNAGQSKWGSVQVSGKHLEKHSFSTSMAPHKNTVGTAIGACSEVLYPARSNWPDSYTYASNYHVCFDPTTKQDLAFTRHVVKVPGAARYGQVRVDAYGQRTVPGFPDHGFLFYETKTKDITSHGGTLAPGLGWHKGDRIGAEGFVNSHHQFHWWAGTAGGAYYDIKSFRVTLSYFLLR
jgi:flagellar hook assembly protein FlgD